MKVKRYIPKGKIGLQAAFGDQFSGDLNARKSNTAHTQGNDTQYFFDEASQSWHKRSWTPASGATDGSGSWSDFSKVTDLNDSDFSNYIKTNFTDKGFDLDVNTGLGKFKDEASAISALGKDKYNSFKTQGQSFHGVSSSSYGNSALGTVGGRASAQDAVNQKGYWGALENERDILRAQNIADRKSYREDLSALRQQRRNAFRSGLSWEIANANYKTAKNNSKAQRNALLANNRDAYNANTASIMNTRLGISIPAITPVTLNQASQYTSNGPVKVAGIDIPASAAAPQQNIERGTFGTVSQEHGGYLKRNYSKFFNK